MTTMIEHPLLEANRLATEGWLLPDSAELIRREWEAGPRTAARAREAVFEVLGEGYRGCIPVAVDSVIDPETVEEGFGEPNVNGFWLAVGPVDDASVLKMANGRWFLLGEPPVIENRQMIGFLVEAEEAARLQGYIDQNRTMIMAIPAARCLDFGGEREYRAFMESADDE